MTYEKSDENMMNWTGKGDEKLQELVNLVYIESGPELSGKVQPLLVRTTTGPSTIIQPLPFTTGLPCVKWCYLILFPR